jgi:hypothetical protein
MIRELTVNHHEHVSELPYEDVVASFMEVTGSVEEGYDSVASSAQQNPATRTHVFSAAPNAFSFFFGQHQKTIGPVTLYEWDFDGLRGGGYNLSLSI